MFLKLLFLLVFLALLRKCIKSYTRKHYKPKYRPINPSDNMDYSKVKPIEATVGGKFCQFSSSAEYKYALLLESKKQKGEIADWCYEETLFTFFSKPPNGTWQPEGIKRVVYPKQAESYGKTRGIVKAYIPDFRITYPDKSEEYVEIKGRWTQRAMTAIENMKKYHKEVKLTVIYPK